MLVPASSLRRYRKDKGFTLIELLVVVVIIGILSAIAVPSFREFVGGQRVKNAAFDTMSILTLARSEAIKRNAQVTANNDGTYITVTTADGTVVRRQEVPKDVIFTGGGAITYAGNGRLVAAVPNIQISNSGTGRKQCISIDLSGRPTSNAC